MDFETVGYDTGNNCLIILDQTRLPEDMVFLSLSGPEEIFEAIRSLRVRGAPAIGVAAAIGMAVIANNIKTASYKEFRLLFDSAKRYLASSRPTAVNLFWALERMARVVNEDSGGSVILLKDALTKTALKIKQEDIDTCRKIGENALPLLQDGYRVLTHCNAGRLAAVRYGTALAPLYLGAERGYRFQVYADETRPLLQGARLTAWELSQAGIPVTVLCDNMASALMKSGQVDVVLVGADRIAANGDTANKIGTSGLAVLARHYGIPFYVLAPTSTIDPTCESGDSVTIEHRAPEEVTSMWYAKPMVPASAGVFNPAFDVTGASLITAIVTEGGIHKDFGGLPNGGSQTV